LVRLTSESDGRLRRRAVAPACYYWHAATCTSAGSHRYTCKATITIDPREEVFKNAYADDWKVHAQATGKDGDIYGDYYGTVKMKRATKLDVDASPEPVKKGRTLTVKGKLTRASWSGTNKYTPYGKRDVKLQFRKKGSSTYSTVKTVKSSSTGALKTNVTASADGYWRWSFAGTSTTAAKNTAGGFVDVR
jgi:hypothetical protein